MDEPEHCRYTMKVDEKLYLNLLHPSSVHLVATVIVWNWIVLQGRMDYRKTAASTRSIVRIYEIRRSINVTTKVFLLSSTIVEVITIGASSRSPYEKCS